MALESTVVKTWLAGLLMGDAAISALVGQAVYQTQAPQGAPKPYLLIIYQLGSDENTFGARALAQPLFQVKAIGTHADLPTLRSLASRADDLLQNTRVVSDGYQIRVQRESEIDQPEFRDGAEYRALGGMYRCRTSLAA